MDQLPNGGGHGADPEDFVTGDGDGGIDRIGAGEGDAAAVVGAGENAEEDFTADVIVDADNDAVAGAGGSLGVNDGDFAVGVEGLHGIASDADGEGFGIGNAEREVVAGVAIAVQRGGEEEGVPHGDEGDSGEAWGDQGDGRAGRVRQGFGCGEGGRCGRWFGGGDGVDWGRGDGESGFFAQFGFEFFDQFDDGFGGAFAVFDVGDVLATDAHHDGEFGAGDSELIADGLDSHSEGEIAGALGSGRFGRGECGGFWNGG
jgi:hypothetical protein